MTNDDDTPYAPPKAKLVDEDQLIETTSAPMIGLTASLAHISLTCLFAATTTPAPTSHYNTFLAVTMGIGAYIAAKNIKTKQYPIPPQSAVISDHEACRIQKTSKIQNMFNTMYGTSIVVIGSGVIGLELAPQTLSNTFATVATSGASLLGGALIANIARLLYISAKNITTKQPPAP